MNWNMDIWSQDDTINSGYPFVTDAGIAEKYTHNSEISIWTIQEDKNNGYPFIADTGTAPGYDRTSVKNMWKMKPNVNFGFPYIIDIIEEKRDAPVFRSFSMSGLSAGFRQTNSSFMLNTRENVVFHFPEQKNIIFRLKFSNGKINLTK